MLYRRYIERIKNKNKMTRYLMRTATKAQKEKTRLVKTRKCKDDQLEKGLLEYIMC